MNQKKIKIEYYKEKKKDINSGEWIWKRIEGISEERW